MNEPRAAGASDFVDRLVGKALGAADVATARVPSAFEPIQPRGATGFAAPPADRMYARDMQSSARHQAHSQAAADTPDAAGLSPSSNAGEAAITSAGAADTSAAMRAWRNTAAGAAASGASASGALMARGLRAGDWHATGDDDAADATDDPVGMRHADRHHDAAAGRDDAASVMAGATGSPGTMGTLGRNAPSTRETAAHAAYAAATARALARGRGRSRGQRETAAYSDMDADAALLLASPASSGFSPADAAAARAARARRSGASDDAAGSSAVGALVPLPHARGMASRLIDEDGRGARRQDATASGSDSGVAGAEPEITVNVTIGRVDVRATQASPSREKRSRASGPQPVSLDEYLGHRGGGR